MIDENELRATIREVEGDVGEAEVNLATVIAALEALPRAEKVRVSAAVQEAFDRLRAAQTRLADLERRLGQP